MQPCLWKLVKEFVSENKGVVYGSVTLSVIDHSLNTLVIPKRLAEVFTSTNDFKLLKKNIIALLAVYGVNKGVHMAYNSMSNKVEPLLTAFLTRKIICAVFEKYKITREPVNVAVVMEKIREIRSSLEGMFVHVFFKLLPLLLVIFITTVNIFFVNRKLGLAIVVGIVVLSIIIYLLPKPKGCGAEKDEVYEYIEDILNNVEMISTTENGIETAFSNIDEKVESYYHCRKKSTNKVSRNQTIGYMLAFVIYSVTIGYLYKLFKNGEVTLKQFESNLLTIGRLYGLVYNIVHNSPYWIYNLERISYCGEWVKDLFSYKCRDEEDLDDLPDGSVRFENVSMRYGDNILLENYSGTIDDKDLVSLYGTSGSGKTTFINMILDIVKPDSGKIFIGGINIEEMSHKTVNRFVTSSQQNTGSLMHDTIYNNITFGFDQTPELRKRIEHFIEEYEICNIFGHDDFLEDVVTKSGNSLSGGQKDVIYLLHCIANTKAKIIILDEPTGTLDNENRANIQRLITDLDKAGKTVIVITHDRKMRRACKTSMSFSKTANPIKR
jgi:ABC-type bacteriocin/lantibiotic exporter with double-glycine peptidase domain